MNEVETRDNDSLPSKRSKFTLPTLDEQSQLNSTEFLLNSNLLNLQVENLLNEVKHQKKASSVKVLEGVIDRIKALLMNKQQDETVNQLWLTANNLDNILLSNYTKSDVSLKYRPPTEIEVIGSFATETITSPFVNVDLALVIPKECFDDRLV